MNFDKITPIAPATPKKIHVRYVGKFWWAWLPANRGWTVHQNSFVIFNRVRVALVSGGFLEGVVIFRKERLR